MNVGTTTCNGLLLLILAKKLKSNYKIGCSLTIIVVFEFILCIFVQLYTVLYDRSRNGAFELLIERLFYIASTISISAIVMESCQLCEIFIVV